MTAWSVWLVLSVRWLAWWHNGIRLLRHDDDLWSFFFLSWPILRQPHILGHASILIDCRPVVSHLHPQSCFSRECTVCCLSVPCLFESLWRISREMIWSLYFVRSNCDKFLARNKSGNKVISRLTNSTTNITDLVKGLLIWCIDVSWGTSSSRRCYFRYTWLDTLVESIWSVHSSSGDMRTWSSEQESSIQDMCELQHWSATHTTREVESVFGVDLAGETFQAAMWKTVFSSLELYPENEISRFSIDSSIRLPRRTFYIFTIGNTEFLPGEFQECGRLLVKCHTKTAQIVIKHPWKYFSTVSTA